MIVAQNGSIILDYGQPYNGRQIVSSYTRDIIVYPKNINANLIVRVFR